MSQSKLDKFRVYFELDKTFSEIKKDIKRRVK